MRYAHPSLGPPLARHLALVDHAALEAPAKLDRLIAGAGIDVSELSRRFENTNPAHEAHEIVAHFYEWLRIHAPDHPVLSLQIMHVDDALAAAGIGPNSRFSTETAAFDRHGNDHCPADEERWFAWIESARALHKCNWWDDDAALVSDICEAVDAYAPYSHPRTSRLSLANDSPMRIASHPLAIYDGAITVAGLVESRRSFRR